MHVAESKNFSRILKGETKLTVLIDWKSPSDQLMIKQKLSTRDLKPLEFERR